MYTFICIQNMKFSVSGSRENADNHLHPQRHQRIPIHQPSTTVLVAMVHRKQNVRLPDDILCLQHFRRSTDTIRSFRNFLQ